MALNLRGTRAELRTRLFQPEGRAHTAVWIIPDIGKMLRMARAEEGGREGETEKRHWHVLVFRIYSQSVHSSCPHSPFNPSSFTRLPFVAGVMFLSIFILGFAVTFPLGSCV